MRRPKFKLYMGTAAVTLALFVLVVSCNKNNSTTTTATEDTGYASDHAMAEKAYDDAQTIADKASTTTGGLNLKTTSCANVTHLGTTITVDFGSTNCMCADGRNRRGKIIINYTGAYADSGSIHTITFDNYYQNDNKIDGTKTVTNMGHNSSGKPYFNITINGTITKTDGTAISANWTRIRTWTAGYNTLLDWTDDVYEITGTGTLVRPAGTVNVNVSASTPLVVALNCRWIEAGSVVYTLPGGGTRTLNYGATAACDNQAQITLANGTTSTITLP